MFIELHLLSDNEKILVNIDRIKSIYRYKGETHVSMGEVSFRVKESYEDVRHIIFYGRGKH